MIIQDGVLMKVELSDLDENGKVIIPSKVERIFEEAFLDLTEVKEVVFNEGVKVVDGFAFNDLPNLKCVVFPKSLEFLGGDKSIGSPVFNTKNVKVVLNSYPQFSKFCFGQEETIDYIKKCFDQIQDKLKSIDIKDVQSAINCYNAIIYHRSYFKKLNPELVGEFDKISKLIISRLSQVQDGKKLGDVLIENCLKNDKILSPALLQYDAYMVAVNGLKLASSYKMIDFTNCSKTAMLDNETKTIEFDMNRMQSRTQKLTKKNEINNLDQNLIMLHVIRHELTHLYHETRSKNTKIQEEKLSYLDQLVQKADNGFETGKISGRIASHDFLPDEIDADIRGLSLLETDLIKFYGFKEKATKQYINKHKIARMQMVYDKYKINENDNYRIAILEEALNSGRLTNSEQTKVEKILDKYLKLETCIEL